MSIKNLCSSSRYPALLLLGLSQPAYSEQPLEEIIVSAARPQAQSETLMPTHSLSGDALRQNSATTLGDTLANQAGMRSASFGPGVGLPVIRGQSGNRVKVLQNQLGSIDASSLSPDHSNSVEALIAERIEVIRGPATLLYGNGAIGGVVNVIDNRVPDSLPETTQGAFEQRHDSVSDQNISVFKVDGSLGQLAWHIDGVYRDSNNVDIPGQAQRNVDHEADDDHDEESHDEHDEEEPTTAGYIGNSNRRGHSLSVGASWIHDGGFVGLSISRLENNYGLPPGVHAHAEGEEEHDDEHEEEHDEEHEDEHEHEEEHEAHGETDVRLDMQQTRIDLKAEQASDGWIELWRGQLSGTQYEHREMEGTEVGTVFENDGIEGRLTANHQAIGNWRGVLGLHLIDRTFSATGDEAFIPASDIRSAGIFAVEEWQQENWHYEVGLRLEQQEIDNDNCQRSQSSVSGSTAALWNYRDDSNLLLSLSRSQRAASVEELFSNSADNCLQSDNDHLTAHAATGLAELGDANLDPETAHNIELAWRRHQGDLRYEVNAYYNQVSDYIYLAETDDVTEEGVEIARYQQQDAQFHGLESQLWWTFGRSDNADQHWQLQLFGDLVRGRFRNGQGNVPRMPAWRVGAELGYRQANWSAKVRLTEVADQDRVAAHESPSDGYTQLSLYTDYHWDWQQSQVTVFVKGNNLLDEEIRHHTSLIKDQAPAAGRGVEAGIRLHF